MKKLLFSLFLVALTVSLFAQPVIDLGLKGGVNFSKMSLNFDDYTSESVTKSHFGAFARIGWGRIFIQPEAYFSGKGGDVTSDITNTLTSFDFSSVDIPVLLGVKIIKGKVFDLHAVAGPVFNAITTKKAMDGSMFNRESYKNNYFSMQYGLGVDVLFVTLDARFEQGLNYMYKQNGNSASNNTFMISVGFKIL